jgi:hypothetical protein
VITLRGKVARRLIDARREHRGEGPGHPDRGNQWHTGVTGGGVPMDGGGKSGGTSKGGHVAAGLAMGAAAAIIEAMGTEADPPVSVTADAMTGPTEMQVEDVAQYIEAHQDLWRQGGALVASVKGRKVTATAAKLTTPATSASTSRSTGPPRVTEYATETRRSSYAAFRPAWGPPPMSIEERAAWLVAHCRAEERLVEMRASSKFRVLQIESRRFGPGER